MQTCIVCGASTSDASMNDASTSDTSMSDASTSDASSTSNAKRGVFYVVYDLGRREKKQKLGNANREECALYCADCHKRWDECGGENGLDSLPPSSSSLLFSTAKTTPSLFSTAKTTPTTSSIETKTSPTICFVSEKTCSPTSSNTVVVGVGVGVCVGGTIDFSNAPQPSVSFIENNITSRNGPSVVCCGVGRAVNCHMKF